jgi:two-component system, OmpR family, catabolic regulation response regulator CreB
VQTPRPHVLFVHDDELMWDFAIRILEPEGYAVETATPPTSVSRLEVGDIDLVVLDLGWPESDGLDLCMRMRSVPAAGHVPIVALTDFPGETRDVLAFGIGPDEFITKPFTMEHLRAAVARYSAAG